MAQTLDRLVGSASVLIVLPEISEEYLRVMLSTRNLPDAKALNLGYLNIRDLFGYDRLILPLPALEPLVDWLGK